MSDKCCDDPDCPACQLREKIQAFKDLGIEVDDAMEMVASAMSEVYPEFHVIRMPQLPGEGTLH